ncbi:MAG: endonuclease/exonuclease/phosphatase family protein [Bacteriovoracaceae bacterium]
MIIKVSTSNIRFDNPKDGKHDWGHRRDILAQVLNNFSSHILGTQEGRKDQIMDLLSLLNEHQIIDNHRSWIKERMYPTLFYNPKHLELLLSGDIWLSQTPEIPGSKSFNSAFPRLCTWAKFKLAKKENSFYVFNCHLDHIRSSTRLAQIKVLIEQAKKINPQSLPFLLLGDFNEGPDGEVRKELKKHYPELFDSWLSLKKDECSSHHNFDGKDEGRRIDWVLNTSPFLATEAKFFKDSKSGVFPSDHYPYIVEYLV